MSVQDLRGGGRYRGTHSVDSNITICTNLEPGTGSNNTNEDT